MPHKHHTKQTSPSLAPAHPSLTDGAPQCQSVLECLAGALGQEGGAHVGGISHQGHVPTPPHLGGSQGREEGAALAQVRHRDLSMHSMHSTQGAAYRN